MNRRNPAGLIGLKPSFGFGDRLGLATPGHLDALREHGGPIRGIFAQQSIREMARTKRTPTEVMAAAAATLADEGFADNWGADADHLKTERDVDYTADAGFVFFTIDPSDHVDAGADDYDAQTLAKKFDAVKGEAGWVSDYVGRTVAVPGGPSITFDEATVQRAAVKYGRAITHALNLASYIKLAADRRGQPHEIELSVDETPQPTTLAEHYIIADRCRRSGMALVSLAPRYVGEFEKGIDYKGDLGEFEATLRDHAAIAAHLGPYKLSLHSGSDKLSIYAIFARVTGGRFHVKTAGTSYLEALRCVARHEPGLFRQIVDFSRDRFDADKATYHISATLTDVAAPADLGDDARLEKTYLDENDGRQVLHVTFGSVLTHDEFGPAVRRCLLAHPDTHRRLLATHFGKHLAALRAGMAEGPDSGKDQRASRHMMQGA
jgi:hypothetical protein